MVQFTVEEENLICMYHKNDRRRTAANIRAALPDMDADPAALARQTADKLDAMHDADFEARQFHFTDECSKHSKAPGAGAVWPLRPALIFSVTPNNREGLQHLTFFQQSGK